MEKRSEQIDEKSFDVLASVKLYQFDLNTFGNIRAETKQRVYDEELTYIAEGINLPLYTEFVLHQNNQQLVYFHEGGWRSYAGGLANNLWLAQREAETDPRRQFLVERAAEDLKIGYQIAALQPGQKLVFESQFPQAECDLYGEKFIGDLGFQPERKMGFLYEAEKTIDGRTILRSQTVDGNEAEAYALAIECGQSGGSIEDMRDAYDAVMQAKYGDLFYAGRRIDEDIPEENAWAEIQKNTDLIDYLMHQIEAIARFNLPEDVAAAAKKRLTIGVWARLKERLDQQAMGIPQSEYSYSGGDSVQAQVESAYESAAARSEVLFGCGGSITGEKAIMEASAKDIFNMIFNNEKKWFGCYYCGAKQYGDPCASHLYCPKCTAEVKDGKVISAGNGTTKKGFLDILAEEFQAWNHRYEIEQAKKKARAQAAAHTKETQTQK